MQKFSEYLENREFQIFEDKFNSICESIAFSGVDFDEWWYEKAIPQFSRSRDEEQLLKVWSEAFPAWRNPYFPWLKPAGWTPAQLQGPPQQPGQPVHGWIDPPPPGSTQRSAPQAATQPQKGMGMQTFKKNAETMTADVKAKFAQAMKIFLKSITDEAKTQNNPHLWQLAKGLYDRVMQSANNLKVDVQKGPADYKNQFNKERDAMQQSKMGTMKNQINNKFVNSPVVQKGSGPTGNNKVVNSPGDYKIIGTGWPKKIRIPYKGLEFEFDEFGELTNQSQRFKSFPGDTQKQILAHVEKQAAHILRTDPAFNVDIDDEL